MTPFLNRGQCPLDRTSLVVPGLSAVVIATTCSLGTRITERVRNAADNRDRNAD